MVGILSGLTDRLSIGHVIRLPLDKGLDVSRRDQLHRVAELGNLAPLPVVGARERWTKAFEESRRHWS